ncbi:NUDIX hydrolase [Candidatus Methylocalor cossyra]|uniref:ADP-ribose pyrophosphatase YjhB, NUDIX family n=1 Tax=Candidatus Methylocalor cossyra TaxID=3108543 RepID=A0ABM9NK22_9GAMM
MIPEPAIGVGALVFDDRGRILLIRRDQEPAVGLWSLPGGRLEPGESLVQCCVREVREETGLTVRPGPIVAVVERRIDPFHYVIVDFLATLAQPGSPPPVPASDASEARWVALPELVRYPLAEGVERVIRAAAGMPPGLGLVDPDGSGRDFLAPSPRIPP